MIKKILQKGKEEKGSFTIFSLFIILGVLAIAAVFMNVSITYMTVNFSKKAMEETVRTRALAVDIPLKEHEGVVEVIHTPYQQNPTLGYVRPSENFLGESIPLPNSGQYVDAANEAEYYAKLTLANSVSKFVGNNIHDKPIVDIDFDNICFDVEPLPENDGYIEFACALKDDNGNTFTARSVQFVKGYNDSLAINHFEDTTFDSSAQRTVRVSNVVFGAAIIEPRSFVVNALGTLGVARRPQIALYSIAYPQIDKCYGDFC